MRVILQRVKKASVSIGGELKASIAEGLLILLGIEKEDKSDDISWLCSKIVNMRIFADENDLMNHSILTKGGDILLVSQFTLFAETKRGNRPGFSRAERPEKAIPLYEEFIESLEAVLCKEVFTGTFGADMQVELINDGPVTISIDTRNKE